MTTGAGVAQPRERFTFAFLTGPGTATSQEDYRHVSINVPVEVNDWTAANGGYVQTATVDVETFADVEYEDDETFDGYLDTTPGVSSAISIASQSGAGTATVTILDDDPTLGVSGVSVTSMPATGTVYDSGEDISITVAFNGVVAVTGAPRFAFDLGGAARHAAYASGTDSPELVFTYTVAAGDEDHDGLAWAADSVDLNGGTIKFKHTDPAEQINAGLGHRAQPALSDHTVDAAAPRLVSAHAADTNLVLVFSEDLAAAASLANSAFTVKKTPAGGSEATQTLGSTAPAIAGKMVTLTLATASAVVASDTNVKVSYTKPTTGSANKLVDATGHETASFADQPVVNQLAETVPPVLQTAAVDGATLVLTYNEPLDTTSVPAAGDFVVRVSGSARGVSTVAVSGAAVTLTLASAVDNSDTVTVSYTAGTNPIRDIARNGAADFMNRAVDNTTVSAPDAPGGVSASPGNGRVTLSWDAPADNGGAAIVRYEYRVSADGGTSWAPDWTGVPDGADPGSDAADERTFDVDGLTNGTAYRLEVRAYNGTHNGPGGSADATPQMGPARDPGAPRNLSAQARDSAATLVWSAPSDTGNRSIIRYEVRHAGRASVPSGTAWTDVGLVLTHTVSNLANDVEHTFEVRAVNSAGLAGPAAQARATPIVNAGAPSAVRDMRANTRDGVVLLYWREPERDGLTTIARYQYRYAPGNTVPSNSPWFAVPSQSGTARTVGYLDNGVRYTFEVRAVNQTREGAVAQVRATPTAGPVTRTDDPVTWTADSPSTFTAESGDPYVARSQFAPGKRLAYVDVTLRWGTPADDGNDYIVRYEHRHASGTSVPSNTPWRQTGRNGQEVKVPSLETGVRYTFEVRAVTATGSGPAVRTGLTTKRYSGPAVTLSVSGTAREGQPFTLGASRNRTQGSTYLIFLIEDEASTDKFYRRADFADGQSRASTTYTPAYDGLRPPQRRLMVRIGEVYDSIYAIDPQVRSVTVHDDDAGLRVDNATVREGPGARLSFVVRLDRTLERAVTVHYATSDGTAAAGQDYTAASGTLTIPAGSRRETIAVAVLDDAINDDGETLTLTLSNAQGAVIDDATATGTIRNRDPLPQAWLARFGRTVGEQAMEAVQARIEGPRAAGLSGSIGGIPGLAPTVGQEAEVGARARRGFENEPAPRGNLETLAGWLSGGDDAAKEPVGVRLPTGRELLAGTSFALTGGTSESRFASFWGRGAVTSFDGRDGETTVDGEVGERDGRGGLVERCAAPRAHGLAQPRQGQLPHARRQRRGRVDADRALPLRTPCALRTGLGVGDGGLRRGHAHAHPGRPGAASARPRPGDGGARGKAGAARRRRRGEARGEVRRVRRAHEHRGGAGAVGVARRRDAAAPRARRHAPARPRRRCGAHPARGVRAAPRRGRCGDRLRGGHRGGAQPLGPVARALGGASRPRAPDPRGRRHARAGTVRDAHLRPRARLRARTLAEPRADGGSAERGRRRCAVRTHDPRGARRRAGCVRFRTPARGAPRLRVRCLRRPVHGGARARSRALRGHPRAAPSGGVSPSG